MKREGMKEASFRFEVIGLRSLPELRRGNSLGRLICAAAKREGSGLRRGDIVVIAQKAVSKVEGQMVNLGAVQPSALAKTWARRLRRDARQVEVVLRESRRIIRMSDRALIVETKHGLICANAGVDRSNVPTGWLTLLPANPDGSARKIAMEIRRITRASVPVIITDTFGRPWRLGMCNFAIGVCGMEVFEDLRGRRDAHGHKLKATVMAVADEIAAAAGLVMPKRGKIPVAIVRGFPFVPGSGSAKSMLRPEVEDLFR